MQNLTKGTSFATIYDSFLARVTSDMYMELSELDTIEMLQELLTKGTLDQLKDCLDFAPEGVIELIKKIAVETELPDTLKRAAITKKTGFNIDNAIMVNRVMDEPVAEEKNEEKVRRTAPISTSEETKTRRTNLPKYNVVNIKTN